MGRVVCELDGAECVPSRWTSGNSYLALIRDMQQVVTECSILQAGCAVRIFFNKKMVAFWMNLRYVLWTLVYAMYSPEEMNKCVYSIFFFFRYEREKYESYLLLCQLFRRLVTRRNNWCIVNKQCDGYRTTSSEAKSKSIAAATPSE
jgi:hypothetical protein